jgi:hypothetical protein
MTDALERGEVEIEIVTEDESGQAGGAADDTQTEEAGQTRTRRSLMDLING